MNQWINYSINKWVRKCIIDWMNECIDEWNLQKIRNANGHIIDLVKCILIYIWQVCNDHVRLLCLDEWEATYTICPFIQ